jgi:23S rRNA (uridine2552-2'-O)-methyltransferase
MLEIVSVSGNLARHTMKKRHDHYYNRAKKENYPARSVYKLQEIDKKFHVLKKGAKVFDLGAAPGSWSLWAAKKVGPQGFVLAVDLLETETAFPDNVAYFADDAFELSGASREAMQGKAPFDLVMSDMAPKTTGIKFTDQARSLDLCEQALALAREVLAPGGNFVVKIFEGPDVKAFTDSLRPLFERVKTFKPKSSRDESKEIFIVGLGYTPSAE